MVQFNYRVIGLWALINQMKLFVFTGRIFCFFKHENELEKHPVPDKQLPRTTRAYIAPD